MKKYLIGGNDYSCPDYMPKKLIKCNLEINDEKFPVVITSAEVSVDPEISFFESGLINKKLIITIEVEQDKITKAVNILTKAYQK